jgi:hypothetical protein
MVDMYLCIYMFQNPFLSNMVYIIRITKMDITFISSHVQTKCVFDT